MNCRWNYRNSVCNSDSIKFQKRPKISCIGATMASFQYPTRRLIVRSCEVSKLWDLCLKLSDRSEIWQAPRQQCCRGTCQISKWCNSSNYQTCVFETSQDLTIIRLMGYWNGTLEANVLPILCCSVNSNAPISRLEQSGPRMSERQCPELRRLLFHACRDVMLTTRNTMQNLVAR